MSLPTIVFPHNSKSKYSKNIDELRILAVLIVVTSSLYSLITFVLIKK